MHGGGPRASAIVDHIASHAADVVVVTEFRAGARNGELRSRIEDAGFSTVHMPKTEGDENSVLIATRRKSKAVKLHPAPIDRHRIVACTLDGLTIAGAYFAMGKDKASLFDYLLSQPEELSGDSIVVGDFNTGIHRLDEAGATFDCEARFRRLSDAGFVDLWRKANGSDRQEYSWYSRGHQNGFRIDHIFGRGAAIERMQNCTYEHGTRDAISDHSALIVKQDNKKSLYITFCCLSHI